MTKTPDNLPDALASLEGLALARTTEVTVTLPDHGRISRSGVVEFGNVSVIPPDMTFNGQTRIHYGYRSISLDDAEEVALRMLAAVRMGRKIEAGE